MLFLKRSRVFNFKYNQGLKTFDLCVWTSCFQRQMSPFPALYLSVNKVLKTFNCCYLIESSTTDVMVSATFKVIHHKCIITIIEKKMLCRFFKQVFMLPTFFLITCNETNRRLYPSTVTLYRGREHLHFNEIHTDVFSTCSYRCG